MIRKETFEVFAKKCIGNENNICDYYQEDDIVCSAENCPYLDYPDKQPILTPEKFADKMLRVYNEEYVEKDDKAEVHHNMDYLICELLRSLGYDEAVYIFDRTPKYYE